MASLELRISISGQPEKVVSMKSRMLVGTLLSNQVVLRATGVDPIHALIEENDKEEWVIIDLDSSEGIQVNGKKVDVETVLKLDDEVTIGSAKLFLQEKQETAAVEESATVVPPPPPSAQSDLPEKSAAAKSAPSKKSTLAKGDKKTKTAVGEVSESKNEEPLDSAHGVDGFELRADEDKEVSFEPQSVHKEKEQADAVRKATVISSSKSKDKESSEAKPKSRLEKLFSPKKARPSGNVVEVVAYWGDTILEVDHFHPDSKGFENATIGDPTKAHFIAAGKEKISSYPLVETRKDSYRVNLRKGMTAKLRREGKVYKAEGKKRIKMGRRDLAQVEYGPVKYFIMYIRPPKLNLPKTGPKDPLLWSMMFMGMLAYLMIFIPILVLGPVDPKEDLEDDPWAIVNLPEERLKPLKPKPKPQIKQKIAKVKTPPKKPPPPKQKPFKPAKPKVVAKPKQVKKVQAPKTQPTKIDQNKQVAKRPPGAKKPKDLKLGKLSKLQGMPSTGAPKPDFKLAGPKNNRPLGPSGGVKGSGMKQRGGRRKGKGKADYKGVEGVKNNKASGVNLSKLGLGAGKVLKKSGPGAIRTNFRSAAGGAGGGSGSANKTYGFGGSGNAKSVGIAGSGSGINNFGSGSGGFGSGQGGSGGLGGAGLGRGTGGGRGTANIRIPEGDPGVSGGLTSQEVRAVIRANLNQIRHCYEQLLQRSPSASGRIVVGFVIGLSGRVNSISIKRATISDSQLRGCVTGKVKRWPFPKPRGGQVVNVSYPFIFSPLDN